MPTLDLASLTAPARDSPLRTTTMNGSSLCVFLVLLLFCSTSLDYLSAILHL